MKKLKFSVKINAPAATVWSRLWNDDSYRKWTSVFSAGSHAESDWNEGSKILFLDAKGDGMFSIIDKKIPNREMTFRHMGEFINGQERPGEWAGAKESYSLTEANGVTELNVEMDSSDDFEIYFQDAFPKALTELKKISEN